MQLFIYNKLVWFYIYKSKLHMVWGNKSKANVCKPCDSLVICVLAAA